MDTKMKGKAKSGKKKIYFCELCTAKIPTDIIPKICPKCGANRPDNFTPIYVEDDPEEEQMRSKIDWQAGD